MKETNRHDPKAENIIIDMGIMYGYPCVLFKYENGYACKWKSEYYILGNVTEKRAIEMFKWNYGLK